MNIKLLLLIICGLFWSVAYIDIIRIGIKNRTYAMPFIALSLNFSWEVYNTIQGYIVAGFHASTIINCFWVLLDIGILYTYFKYGNIDLKKQKIIFNTVSILVLVFSFILQYYIGSKLGLVHGALYSAFYSNLLMSILFIRMFFKRTNLQGQTFLIAITKCIGTLSITILVGAIGINRFGGSINSILFIGLITFIIDIWYVYLVNKRALSLNNLK